MRAPRWCLIACVLVAASNPARGAELELRGSRLSQRQVAALLAPALRAPGDSLALIHGLGRLVARLQDAGLLDARATAVWRAPDAARLRVDVREGRAYRFERIDVRAYSPAESLALATALALRAGDPASASRVDAAMDRALDAALEQGHPYVRLAISSWEVDSAAVRLTLTGSLGPDVTFAGVRVDGAHVTQAALLGRAVGPLTGPYRQSMAAAARDRVERLGLFRRVELLQPEGAADFHQARVVLRVEERPYNQFEGVLGSQGSGGLVGLVRIELENLAGSGRSAAVRWEGRGHGVTQALARYREPLVFGLPVAIETAIEEQTFDTLYTRTQARAGGRWSLSGHEHLEADVVGERVVQDQGEVGEAAIQTTRLRLLHERFDDPLVPQQGWAMSIEASQSFTRQRLRDHSRRTVRSSAGELGLRWFRPIGVRAGLALEARVLGRIGNERVLALYDRVPLGGATSLRGYDEEAFRVDRVALTRLEWRTFLPARQYAFLFWDHASAGTRLPTPAGDRLQLLNRDGFGAGLSLAASAGRVALTYGVASGLGPLEGKLHIQLLTPF